MRRLALIALSGLALAGCHKNDAGAPDAGPAPIATHRCDADLSAYLQATGQGAFARTISGDADLIGGEAAIARSGDVLLANDKIRVVIQQPGRSIQPDPYGGALIDADLVHGGPGNDKFGKLAPFFNFGRTVNVDTVEILAPGGQGGAAIVAATGTDTVNDYINANTQLQLLIAGENLQLNPDDPVNLRVTTYYALKPGETHVGIVTALCNDNDASVLLTVGDLIDSGGDVAVFNPQGASGGFGYTSNPDPLDWIAWLATDNSIAYGVAPWKLNDLSTPETHSNSLSIAGVTGYLIGNKGGLTGIAEWLTPDKRNRSGSLVVAGKDSSGKPGTAVFGREFAVGKDVAAVAESLEGARAAKSGAALATYGGTVRDPAGPVAGARVVAERPDPDGFGATLREAVFVTDAAGHFQATLPSDSYTFTAYKPGHAISSSVAVAAGADGSEVQLQVGASHQLSVRATDLAGHPIPAKLTVLCNGACPTTPAERVRFEDYLLDVKPDDVERVAFIPPSGSLTLDLPVGSYQVMVTHGPEDSIWPLTAPAQGQPVDLTSADQALNAKLSKVVDTSGWLSADFHVHCVNSPDSPVAVEDRVKTFLAEDVNVLLATDHDFITDYAPMNQQLGGTGFMATMVGEEITTFDYGHYNPWPRTRDTSDPVTFGAVDWAGGTGPGLHVDDIIDAARAKGASTFQINHPNGNMSTFGSMLLDADTLKTHAEAARFRLPPSPYATADDTGLFPRKKWDAMEVMNGFARSSFDGLLNNWMTFNANGLVVTATAVSDTHLRWSSAGGYPRSYVRMPGHDSVATFDQALMSQDVNAHQVAGSLGLFVKAFAFKSGTPYQLATVEADCTAAGPACARVGDTLSIGSGGLDVVVDVQSPEWIKFDEVSLLDHRAARWMTHGTPDPDFAPEQTPAEGAWVQSVALGAGNLEAVATGDASLGCGQSSCPVNRWHAQVVFHIDAASGQVPTGDDFYFVVVRDSTQSRDLMPLVFDGVMTRSGSIVEKAAHAFAFTNALYIDADGSGAYDHFPHLPVANKRSRAAARPQATGGTREQKIARALHELATEP
jgi:hypothetical protein